MTTYIEVARLQVAEELYNFVNDEALQQMEIEKDDFWQRFSTLIYELSDENEQLLIERQELQKKINEWHRQNKSPIHFERYKHFLKKIQYLEKKPEPFNVSTEKVDDEVAILAGPQLVVPANNARYALNAANARWGSLYDALYGTDVIPSDNGREKGKSYNPSRGKAVIQYAKQFLDQAFPLKQQLHHQVASYFIENDDLIVQLQDGKLTKLNDAKQFIGFTGEKSHPTSILLKNNGLHVEVQFDAEHPVGLLDPAHIKDIYVEAALSTILDCEDSVAAVDAEDKVEVYRNLLQIMQGTLTSSFHKNGQPLTRTLNEDRQFKKVNGEIISLKGRSLLFMRNVGHLMTNPAIKTEDGREVYEGIMDGVITTLLAMHNFNADPKFKNTEHNSIYIVKPKMHGSKEAKFANTLFNRIEDLYGLERHTLKIGLMDEERRTSLNLAACIHEVKDRIAFINTGFLDRTGDEIHTSMEAGVMIRKNAMKQTTWLQAYEKSNVGVGLSCGLDGRAQIGKGMWAMPDNMKQMMQEKVNHPKAGANTAWVPSPTAATLHALHYHYTDVRAVQQQLKHSSQIEEGMLQVPIAAELDWTPNEIAQELDNNVQGILGYVVRWIDQGVGCSKVLDIHNVGLMEDRATLRISSQHIANWLRHGIVNKKQVEETLQRMAVIVDEQNKNDAQYKNMAPNFEQSIAFQAASELIFEGLSQPNGYTEPILHKRRLQLKAEEQKTFSLS